MAENSINSELQNFIDQTKGDEQGNSQMDFRTAEAVLREAYRRAGVSPGHVQYVEAHGTGTFLSIGRTFE